MSTGEDDEQDLTRKQRREQARAERKALEEAEATNVQRRKRLIQLGSVAGVVVVIIAVILIATSGGGSSPGIEKTKGEPPKAVAEVTSLLQGIPQNENTLGSPKAPVTMEYFGDLECPICKEFTLGALPTLIQKYVRTGKLKLEYRNLETATREPETFKTQQVAALVLHRALLPPAGRREHRIRDRKIPADARPAGAWTELRQLDVRAQRTELHEHHHERRAGGEQRRLHGHAVLPDRQDGRPAAEARILLADRSGTLRIGDREAAQKLGER
jgi:hypothetical protein